jgi:DNA-binding NarL/FixJ family response regulator
MPRHYQQSENQNTSLTPAENVVLNLLISQCYSNPELAAALGVSASTVTRHLQNIMDKTGYSTRLELAVRTLQYRESDVNAK